MLLSGKSLVTTEPAPIIQFFPTLTSGRILAPDHTSVHSPIDAKPETVTLAPK